MAQNSERNIPKNTIIKTLEIFVCHTGKEESSRVFSFSNLNLKIYLGYQSTVTLILELAHMHLRIDFTFQMNS